MEIIVLLIMSFGHGESIKTVETQSMQQCVSTGKRSNALRFKCVKTKRVKQIKPEAKNG